MAAVPQQVNKQALKNLVPLNGLSHAHFEELISKSEVKDLGAGRFLFREGDRDGLTYFLLSGEIALQHGREVKQTLKAGSEEARHPIGHTQPRQWSAKVKSRVSVLVVDSGLLDVLLAWDQTNSYEVTDIQAEDDEDWMTRMLSSDLFQRLPANNIQQLLMRMEEYPAEAGARIVSQDDPGDYYYIVKQGVAEVSRKPSSQSKPIKIAQLRVGDSFGEEALLSGSPRNANVTMVTDGVLMRLAKVDFDALLREPLIEQVDYKQACQEAKGGAVWLDVRLPGEFQNAHLPDSTNLPLAAVRDANAELDPDQRYIVCCDTGTRSVGAAFLLNQRGFEAVVLRGGLNAVPHDQLQRSEAPARQDHPPGAAIIDFSQRGADAGGADTADARAKADAIIQQAEQKAQAMRAELKTVQQQVAERLERVAGLEQAIEAKEKELRDLHRSFERAESLGEDVERLGAELASAQAQLKDQRAQLDQARSEGAEQEQELVLLREQAREQQSELEQLQGERKQQVEALEAARAELKQLRERGGTAERELGERLEAAEAERDRVRAALAEQEQALAEASARVEQLQQERSTDAGLSGQLQERQQQVDTLQQELTSALARHAEQQAQLEQLQRDHAAALQAQESRADEAQAQVQQHEARILELQQQLVAGNQALTERERLVAEHEAELERMRSSQGEQEARLQQLQDEAAQSQGRLNAQIADLQAREQTLIETVEGLKRERDASADDLHQRIAALEEDLQQRDRSLAEKEQSLAALQEQLESAGRAEQALSDRETEWSQTEAALQSELDGVRNRAEQLDQQLRQDAAEHERSQQALQERVEALQQELDQRVAALDEHRSVSADSEAELASLREQLTTQQEALDQARNRQTELESELARVQAAHAETEQSLRSRVEELQAESEQRAATLEEQRREAAESDTQLSALRSDYDSLQARLDQLQNERQTREDQLQVRIAELQDQLGARAETLEEQDAERERLRCELDELRQARERLQEEFDAGARTWSEQRVELEARIAEQEQERDRIRSELEQQLSRQRSELQAEADQLRRETDQLRTDHEELNQALAKAREDKDRRVEELRQVQDERGKLREQVAELESWMVRAERKRDDHERQLDEKNGELTALREQLEQLRNDANVARERSEALQKQIDAGDRQLDEHSVQLREDAAAARAEVCSLQERLQSSQRDVEQLEQQRNELDAEHEQLRDQVDALNRELEQVRAQYRDAAEEAGREREELELHVEALEQEKAKARERMEAAVGAQRDAESAIRSLEQEADQLRRKLEQKDADLAEARAAAEHAQQAVDPDAAAEVASIRELADQELRTAAAEIARLKGDLEEARSQVRHMETEVALLRDLDGPEPPHPGATDIQRQVDERLSHYKQESDAALESMRQQNRTLQDELQRLQRSGQSLPSMRAEEPARRRATGQAEDRPRKGGPKWAMLLLMTAALAGVGGWYWSTQQPTGDAGTAEPAASPVPRSLPEPSTAAEDKAARAPVRSAAAADDNTAGNAEPAPMRPGRTYQDFLDDGGVGPVMVQLPGGSFTMGSPDTAPYFDERPARSVQLKPFSMAKYEVTFAEYDQFAQATGRPLPNDSGWGRGQRPVVGVNWEDARAYAQWLSDATGHRYRLPTEAEWEYAVRGGTGTFYWWGNRPEAGNANCFDCAGEWSGARTAPVGSFPANPMGLYDMSGNAMEWVQDCYRDSYQGAPVDGGAVQVQNCGARVARGGSYRSVLENLRSARRDRFDPEARLDQIGFRLVREP